MYVVNGRSGWCIVAVRKGAVELLGHNIEGRVVEVEGNRSEKKV